VNILFKATNCRTANGEFSVIKIMYCFKEGNVNYKTRIGCHENTTHKGRNLKHD
jgi:hypothetical protein